ncbi:uncharacterized protein C8Q71DRAFT_729275 [Rhodofomes roseus]|uniref:Uncharacterized protein n=1 Tax=Rhodofomes roseus TaxID=34475 RepID=A0ABQ8KX35_9APHY|nr:uncharacterized protein C8Q71DRAFT_729275 [Rhodofomes roseus]KAH9843613.1 hypothetical protein C8Q71DRAFT_729275 [Rhodofomes roseus]
MPSRVQCTAIFWMPGWCATSRVCSMAASGHYRICHIGGQSKHRDMGYMCENPRFFALPDIGVKAFYGKHKALADATAIQRATDSASLLKLRAQASAMKLKHHISVSPSGAVRFNEWLYIPSQTQHLRSQRLALRPVQEEDR